MDFKKIVGSMMFFSLLVFCVLSFVIDTQDLNNSPEKIIDNSLINKTFIALGGNLSDAQSGSQTSSDIFGEITPEQEIGVLDVTSVISPTRIFKTITIGLFNSLILLPSQILGINPIVFSSISSILLLLIIIGIWAIWKGVIN